MSTTIADKMVDEQEAQLGHIDIEKESAGLNFEESERVRNEIISKMQALRAQIAHRTAEINTLSRRLPSQEGNLVQQRRELASLRGRVATLEMELEQKRKLFNDVISDANNSIRKQALQIEESFAEYARDFLFEDCGLSWAPKGARLGQTGQRFLFPFFELDLGGSDFINSVRRSGPDEVSESQREFIDISFRMALAKVATAQHVTTLAMDAPESSLDAVFVTRAASVLGKFGRTDAGNRLIVTSNLVDGNLIPNLLKNATEEANRLERVVDLLTIAAPTAAVRNLREEYVQAMNELLDRANAR